MEEAGLSVNIWFAVLFLVMGYASLFLRESIDLTIATPRFGLRAAIDYREKSKKDQAGKTLVDSEKLLQYATDIGIVMPPPPGLHNLPSYHFKTYLLIDSLPNKTDRCRSQA
jgi:hypothetical protein